MRRRIASLQISSISSSESHSPLPGEMRASGVLVRWRAVEGGFRFDGLRAGTLPTQWLDNSTRVRGPGSLVLGPEPLIGPQQVILVQPQHPEHALRVATDGLRPFTTGPAP